jgi:hypothetical protein
MKESQAKRATKLCKEETSWGKQKKNDLVMICCSSANEGATTGNEQTHSAVIMTVAGSGDKLPP